MDLHQRLLPPAGVPLTAGPGVLRVQPRPERVRLLRAELVPRPGVTGPDERGSALWRKLRTGGPRLVSTRDGAESMLTDTGPPLLIACAVPRFSWRHESMPTRPLRRPVQHLWLGADPPWPGSRQEGRPGGHGGVGGPGARTAAARPGPARLRARIAPGCTRRAYLPSLTVRRPPRARDRPGRRCRPPAPLPLWRASRRPRS